MVSRRRGERGTEPKDQSVISSFTFACASQLMRRRLFAHVTSATDEQVARAHTFENG
jgi:hypothetical protein